MTSPLFTTFSIIILGFLLLVLLLGPLRSLLVFVGRAIAGCLAIAAAGALFGTTVGVNLLTAVFVGVLGLPGFLTLFLLQVIL